MREIKFRVWLKDCETLNPYAIYFDLESISQGSIMARDSEWHYLVNLKESIEQYTGLKDIDGEDIYEGDTLIYLELEPEYRNIEEVSMIRGSWQTDSCFGEDFRYCKLVGNIHENGKPL